MTSTPINWETEEKKLQDYLSGKTRENRTLFNRNRHGNYKSQQDLLKPLEITAKHREYPDFWIRAVISRENYGSLRKMEEELSNKRIEFYTEITERQFKKHLAKIPGHRIKLHPPVIIKNTLPVDLHVILTGTGVGADKTNSPPRRSSTSNNQSINVQSYHLKPKQIQQIHNLNKNNCLSDDSAIKLSLQLQDTYNFPNKSKFDLILPTTLDHQTNPNSQNYTREIILIDRCKRELILKANITIIDYASVMIEIYCPYLIVNETGLPLVFSQVSEWTKNKNNTAAGQFQEHEFGRMVQPLLFSFPDQDNFQVTFRLGRNGLHQGIWCENYMLFSADNSFWRTAKSSTGHSFEFGISVKTIEQTKVVTFRPKYILINQTNFTLHFSKQEHIYGLFAADPVDEKKFDRLLPKSSSIYHWNDSKTAADTGAKLCLRVCHDKISTRWSGGFRIDEQSSVNINVREELGQLFNLFHVQTKKRDAVYYTTVTQFDKNTPPPYLICNQSQVSLMLKHDAVQDDSLMMSIEPNTDIHYCLDEPTSNNTNVWMAIRNVSKSEIKLDLNEIQDSAKERIISYPVNFYIEMSESTSDNKLGSPVKHQKAGASNPLDSQKSPPLVWDAQMIEITGRERKIKMVLKEYSKHLKSQLWRQDMSGRLINDKYNLYVGAKNIEVVNKSTEAVLTRDKSEALVWEWIKTNNSTSLCVKGNSNIKAKVFQFSLPPLILRRAVKKFFSCNFR